MRAPRRFALFTPALLVLGAFAGSAQAVDYKSVGPGPAIMYDAPGTKARKLFMAPAGMPVEVVVTSGDWSRVRDAAGDLAWIESKALTDRRMLVVESTQAIVRNAASDSAPVAFTAGRGVLLEVAEPISSGWIKVRHRDGDIGFVKAIDVWGE